MRLLWFNLATDIDDPVLGFTTAWLSAMAKRVLSLDVITMRAGRLNVPDNVRVYSVGQEKGYSKPRRVLEFYRHLFGILRQRPIDGCFSHMNQIFSVLAAPVLKFRQIPLVTWYAHPSLTNTLKLAHFLSDRMVASLPTAYPYKHDKLTVIGQGIDTDLFSPNGDKPDYPPMILCVGRLSAVKDHPTLLKAVALLQENQPQPFRVDILGTPLTPQDRVYLDSLLEMRRELGLQDLVQFHGSVSHSELPSWYRRCNIFVNLTPTGFGDKVALEAMACGRPCICSNTGFKKTLGQYASKLLFHYKDPHDLYKKMEFIMKIKEDQRNDIGLYLRTQIIQNHSLFKLCNKLMDILNEL